MEGRLGGESWLREGSPLLSSALAQFLDINFTSHREPRDVGAGSWISVLAFSSYVVKEPIVPLVRDEPAQPIDEAALSRVECFSASMIKQ